MSDQQTFITNILKLREHFKLNKGDIDILTGFSQNKYSRIENGDQEAVLSDLTSIANIYNLNAFQLLNPKLKIPMLSSLPDSAKTIIRGNSNATLRNQGKWNLNENIIIILNKYRVSDTFTNSEIIAKLPKDLSKHMTGKSIEWVKGILKELVIDTKKTQPSLTGSNSKPEKIYELVTQITPELLKKAKDKIGKESVNEDSI